MKSTAATAPKAAAKKEMKEPQKIQISLKIENETILQKLTQADSAMPSWVLGEEIAKRIDRRQSRIEIDLSALFLTHQV